MNNILKGILNKEKIRFNKITKSNSGFTNSVYFIDDSFVIKISYDKAVKKP